MIKYFSVENFMSIRDEVTMDFDLGIDQNNHFAAQPVIGFMGANASGKTATLKALGFTLWFIKDSFLRQDPDTPLEITPFVGSNSILSSFKIIFKIDNKDYEYSIQVEKGNVKAEILVQGNTSIFERNENSIEFNNADYYLPTKNIRNNASFLSYANQFPGVELYQLIHNCINHYTNVNFKGFIDYYKTEWKRLLADLYQDKLMYAKTKELFAIADLGITDFRVVSKENKIEVYFKHKIQNKEHEWLGAKENESSGTLQFAGILFPILKGLSKGASIILDEFDMKLHQDLAIHLIKLFQNPETNPKGAQLIMSFHNSNLLDAMLPEQFWMTEKNDEGVTEVFCAADFEDAKFREMKIPYEYFKEIKRKNLENLYRVGRFGAIPRKWRADG